LLGCRQSPGFRSLPTMGLELRSLPSTGVTRLHRYYEPLRHPRRPGLSLTGVRLRVTRPHRSGFPVFRWISSYRHAVVITPVARWVRSLVVRPIPASPWSPAAAAFPFLVQGRRPHWSFRGLLNVHSRYGLPARCTAVRYICLEGSDGFVTSTAAPIATGWSDPVARRDSHPLKILGFSRRTTRSDPERPRP
jgi:hypothetical protein